VKIGYPGALAIAEDGTLWGWGYVLGQQNGTLIQHNLTITQQGTNANWKQIALNQYGSSSTWLLTTDGTIFYIRFNIPQFDPGPGSGWAFIETDGIYGDRIFAIKTDGTLWTITPGYPPYYGCTATQVGTDSNWKMISCGGYLYDNPDDPDTQYTRTYRFAIKTNGTLWGWGSNYNCELGLGGGYYDDSRATPTQIGTATDWKVACADMGSGGFSAGGCAIKTNGTLWGWGANYAPWSSGPNDTYSIPVQYGTDTNWKDVQHGPGYGAGYAFIKGV
jgi:alpha-tubulin suppressor-like RCC1 family protein